MMNEINQTSRSSPLVEREIPMTVIVNMNRSRGAIDIEDINPARSNTSIEQNVNNLHEEEQPVRPVYTVEDTCRVCLSSNQQNMVSLFSTKNCRQLASMFLYVTSIKVDPEENLPLQVCKSCQEDVIKCYNFKNKCQKSDSVLRSCIDEKIKTDINKSLSDISFNKSDKEHISLDNINSVKLQEDSDAEYINIKIESVEEDVEYLEEDFCIDTDDINLDNDKKIKEEKKELDTDTVKIKKGTKNVLPKKSKKRNKQLECDICCKKFLKMKTLKLHMQQYHSSKAKKPFPCPQCKESFHSEHDRHLHAAIHAPVDNKWSCNKCQKKFNVKHRLRRHIRRHMEWKRHACETCGKRFAELCSLRRHARVHTGELLEKKHHCDVCGKRFIDRTQLTTHVARHTGESACACEQCGKAFRSRRLLISHRRVHTDHKPHACRYCPRRFRHESTRNTHHRTHTGEKPYVCSTCGKTFIQNSNLTRHMRTHTGEKPYTCDICGRKFSLGSTLTHHRRTHTGEKPYGCTICGKKFARTDSLPHARQHTGERPFACCACPKAFASAARLRDHYLIHTDEKAFECAICSAKFKKKSYLVKHLKCHNTNLKNNDRQLLLMQEESSVIGENVIVTENDSTQQTTSDSTLTISSDNYEEKYSNHEEIPLGVSKELVVQDSDVKAKPLVVEEEHNNFRYHGAKSYKKNDINLVTLNGKEVHMPTLSLKHTPVKLYQLDQSLVQIESSGGNVTIRKITSKMTTNF